MKKRVVYYQRNTEMSRELSGELLEQRNQIEENVNRNPSNELRGIIFDSDNSAISTENQQFMQMLETMIKDKIETVLTIRKECISDDDHDVYLMCKLAEDNGIEIKFVNDKLSSKDIIKEYEENNMTGLEMNL